MELLHTRTPTPTLLSNAGNTQISNFQIGPSVVDAALLLVQHVAPNALPNSTAMYDGPKCYPETRKAIMRKLRRWIRQQEDVKTKLTWLHGGAGAGKSAILRTIALGDDNTQEHGISTSPVLGSFFFSRIDPTRNTAEPLIPTLAAQLCNAHPAARDIIIRNVDENRATIFSAPAPTQVHSLLEQPLHFLDTLYEPPAQTPDSSQPGRVFIIDGLDECDPKKQFEVIEAIALLVQNLPVRVLLASRPEEPISSAIRHNPILHDISSEISLSDDPDSDADIRLFLEERLKEVRNRYMGYGYGSLPVPWPTRQDIQALVSKSSNHFIFASTAEKYISSGVDLPDIALRVILGLQPPRTGQPFEGLDHHYRFILHKAQFLKEVLDVLALNLHLGISDIRTIAFLLGCRPVDIHYFLSDIGALVVVDSNEECIRWRHKSFSDFLLDNRRALEFSIGTKRQFHRNHLELYFTLLDAYIATSDNHGPSDELVRGIIAGVASSPQSDTTTALIKQHPPNVIYQFLSLSTSGDLLDTLCGSYLRAIGQYDYDNVCVYQDSLKDFLYHQLELVSSSVAFHDLDDLIIPLVSVGCDIRTLCEIYHQLDCQSQTDLGPIFQAFYFMTSVGHTCPHRYPARVLRRIHQEAADGEDILVAATLKILRMVTKFPGLLEEVRSQFHGLSSRFQEQIGSVLKVVPLVLPMVTYRQDIASYARCELPDPADLEDTSWEGYQTPNIDLIIHKARRAMDTYLQRGSPGGGRYRSDEEGGYSEEVDEIDGYDPECRICNVGLEYE